MMCAPDARSNCTPFATPDAKSEFDNSYYSKMS